MVNHIENEVARLLDIFHDRLRQSDVDSIRNLLEHAEWGIALEDLCAQLFEYDASLTEKEFEDVRGVCESIGIDRSDWEPLRDLIGGRDR